jgi:hypothetical protein
LQQYLIYSTPTCFGYNPQPFSGSYVIESYVYSTLDVNLNKKLVKCCIWSVALYDAETWTLWKVYQKYPESFDVWCWRKMEKISWTDRVRNEVLLRVHRVQEERNILHEIKGKKTNWIGHILCRKCLLKYVPEGKIERGIEVTGRRGRRCKQLLDDFKETVEYWITRWKRLWICRKIDFGRKNE